MTGALRFGLIGYGAMGRFLASRLLADDSPVAVDTVLLRRARQDVPAGARIVATAADMIARCPSLVAECAGHGAVREIVPDLLAAGIDVVLASVGALSDEALRRRLLAISRASGARLIVPAGAVGGLDALRAARAMGLEKVIYVGRKPALAWLGTPAETEFDLAALAAPTTIFAGSAAEAALAYPKNANVTAAVALAGAGFEATRVRLIADPDATLNSHEIEASGAFGDFRIELRNHPLPDNPKTSMLAALSLELAVRLETQPSAY